MKYPVLINILQTIAINNKPKEVITTAVIDIDLKEIKRIVRQPDGFVSIKVEDGWLKLAIGFEELYDVIRHQGFIDERFKELTDAYGKDNYNGIPLNNGRSNGEHETTD